MNKALSLIAAAPIIIMLLALTSSAQTIPGGGGGGGSAPCSAFGTTAGTCLQGAGALGTPSSGTATNITGLPISSGVSGLGTGIATALGTNVGSAGAPVVNGGVLGTPSAGTLTNATGLPISTGVSGLGSGVAAALAATHDATGGICTVGGTGCPAGGSSLTTAAIYYALGDSITAASTGVTTPIAQGYAYLLTYDIGAPVNIFGTPGAMACDNIGGASAFANTFPSTLSSNAFFTTMFGVNEANTKGTGGYEVNFHACNQATIEWFSLPAPYWVYAQAATLTGTWVADTSPQTGVGETSTTNGSTATFSITTNGGPIYLLYRSIDGDAGSFTYAVDSGSTTTVNTAAATAILTGLGQNTAMFSIRIPGISAGTHSVAITVTSATGAGHTVDIWAVGSPYSLPYAPRTSMFVGGVLRQQNDTNAATTAAYNSDAQSDATTLSGDGLPVKFVNVRNFVNATSDMFNTLHPNVTGQEHLKEAFESVIQPILQTTPTTFYSSGGTGGRYLNLNPSNTSSSSNLNQGALVYSSQPYGIDLGFDSTLGQYSTRLFANSGGVSFGYMPTNPTGQSSFQISNFFDLNGHVWYRGSTPTVSGTGTPTLTTGSTDTAGEVTAGASATSIVITFSSARTNAPFCTVVPQTQLATFSYTISTTAITITQALTSGDKIDYQCIQH